MLEATAMPWQDSRGCRVLVRHIKYLYFSGRPLDDLSLLQCGNWIYLSSQDKVYSKKKKKDAPTTYRTPAGSSARGPCLSKLQGKEEEVQQNVAIMRLMHQVRKRLCPVLTRLSLLLTSSPYFF
jgi:hypothetical protein